LKKSRFISLRYRYIFITSIMLLILLTTIALVLGTLQTRTIQGRIEKQGLIIAKNLAAISFEHLITYNYIAMEKLVNQTVNDPDIIYVIVHDKEGRIAGHSRRPDFQSRFLGDKISLNAVKTQNPLITIHNLESTSYPVMDVAVPVYLPDSKDRWGTIRVGLSLEVMSKQIEQTIMSMLILGLLALVIGILISNWAAQRVTKPLKTLVQASIEAAQGNLEQKISIATRDEVEILASNFSSMIKEIVGQKQQLVNHLLEIKRLQQYAQKVLDTMSDGLLGIDLNGVITSVNPAAYIILGISPETIVKNSHFSELFDRDNQFSEYIKQTLENPITGNQHEIHLKRGENRRIILTDSGVLEPEGETLKQVIFNLNDITALKKLEAEIRQNQRLADLGTMAAGMAHEIRNPLSAIKTYVALLPQKIETPGFLEKFQKTVPREINRLNTIIEELLELSRPPHYNFKLIDIQLLLKQSTELMEEDFNSKGIDCTYKVTDKFYKIMADENQLTKVFINLMKNGAQAMPDGGQILILAYCTNSWVIIEFKDTGHGFSSKTAKNIFNPFFTTKAKGTGLGLAITHKVITEHGGTIEVKSKKEKGSCFSIRLPEFQN
jgi:PAS domain S-box-containing protein